MGFLKPNLPALDMQEWKGIPRGEKIRRMAARWAESGAGTPTVLHGFYLAKIVLYVLGGWSFALATKGIDGFTDVGSWWSEPIVFEKVVLYTMLFEVIGLGCGFGPLNSRLWPPMGSILYWLRPGTIRLPPWPNRIPLTRGTTRRPADVALYAALLVLLVVALFSDGSGPIPQLGTDIGLLPSWQIWVIVTILGLLGLRDKVIFLAARGEVYGSLTVVFLFGGADVIVGAKLVMLLIWVGAATSKLNKHFPFVVASMLSNNPFIASKWVKRRLYRRYPDDLRPGTLAKVIAHASTVIEMGVPLVLFFSGGGWVTAVAAFVMIVFHLNIVFAIPMGVPLEWNVFMIFGMLSLFVARSSVRLSDLQNPIPALTLFAVLVACIITGNVAPRKVSFLPGMRYYAGNWDTSLWCMTPAARDRLEATLVAIPNMPKTQLEKFYSNAERVEVSKYLGFAFRAMFAMGRGYFTLLDRLIPIDRQDDYLIEDGERIATFAIGWNFGDGHFHNEQLMAALQERCRFEPGEVQAVMIDGQPIHRQRLQYRLVDAALGELESGHFEVRDLISRQPWDADVPVHLHGRAVNEVT
ncbi:MAG: DUF3556 domain-containing protein [Mycobacterium sp.]